jgi:hypothetical protein
MSGYQDLVPCKNCGGVYRKTGRDEPKVLFGCYKCPDIFCRLCLAHVSLDAFGNPEELCNACVRCFPLPSPHPKDDHFFNNSVHFPKDDKVESDKS